MLPQNPIPMYENGILYLILKMLIPLLGFSAIYVSYGQFHYSSAVPHRAEVANSCFPAPSVAIFLAEEKNHGANAAERFFPAG